MHGRSVMSTIDTVQGPPAARVGQVLRIRLFGGQRIEGTLARADGRTLRLQASGRSALVVVYRQAIAAIEEVRRPKGAPSMALVPVTA